MHRFDRRAVSCGKQTMRHLVLESGEVAEKASAIRLDGSNLEIRAEDEESFERENVDIATSIEDKEAKREKFFSLELFPSKTNDIAVYESFFSEIRRSSSPLFYALTWHDKSHFPLDVLRTFPANTLLHIAAKNLKKADVVDILNDVIAHEKTNIFVLRGDGGQGSGDFAHASDLVKFVRENFETKFNICVAGYPQMHPESVSKKEDLRYLKEKVDAGADFVITQIFFESQVFIDFVKDCRSSGIAVPIIPGIFPIPNYKSLKKMATLCSVEVPRKIMEDLEPMKTDDEAVCAYGVDLARKLIAEIFESRAASGFHLFTLNRASIALNVCENLIE